MAKNMASGAYPRVEHLNGSSLRLASELIRKIRLDLKGFIRDKHSSLLQTFIKLWTQKVL